ncbi:Rpn family recombination-promoting nuclease/putative transposase [Bacillus tianshenii]|nr:Rpn family recombination-promoting nuclease/putative transposase [Bacillus tianshenii]
MTTVYQDHDRWFKELLGTFFEEFFAAFFPHVSEAVDFEATTFLSEELFTDILEGEKRRVDLLAKVRLRQDEAIVIIHVEPQSYKQEAFNERMFVYFSRLYEKHRKPILPVAVFSYDENYEERDTFEVTFPFKEVLRFAFDKLELRKLNWRDYLKAPNPAAAALLSKMNYSKAERVQVKKEFLRMLVKMELDDARMTLITGFFERYLKLNPQEETELRAEITTLPEEEEEAVMKIETSWHKKGREEGLQEGKQEGLREGIQAVARKMLQKGLTIEEIKEFIDLPEEEIKKLKGE